MKYSQGSMLLLLYFFFVFLSSNLDSFYSGQVRSCNHRRRSAALIDYYIASPPLLGSQSSFMMKLTKEVKLIMTDPRYV